MYTLFDLSEVLIELCSLPGPAGFEQIVAERVKTSIQPYVDETWIDAIGNVIGVRRSGKEGARKLLFDAHIDEIGLIVTGADEGFLRFAALGGEDERILPASVMKIMTDPPRYGVIGVMPPHLLQKEDTDKTIKIEDMFLDAGLTREEALAAVPQGTPCVFGSPTRSFGENCLCGKALDNRAGFAAILRALESLGGTRPDADVYVMASVQEEVGVRGAAPGVFAIAPDQCVIVDAGYARTPDFKPHEPQEVLGGGVIISYGPNMSRGMTELAIKLARDNGIKHQVNVEPGDSGTNARAIQVSREGVATALFSIPLKYMHGMHEVVSLEDIESTARLLCEIAKPATGGELK